MADSVLKTSKRRVVLEGVAHMKPDDWNVASSASTSANYVRNARTAPS